MWLDPITVRIEHRAQFDLRAWRDLFPECLVSSTLIGCVALCAPACRLTGGYSNLEPLLPIPNRTVKRVCADDSVHSHAKVGHRQTIPRSPIPQWGRAFLFADFYFSGARISPRGRPVVEPQQLD